MKETMKYNPNVRRLTEQEANDLAKNRDLRRLTDDEYKKLLSRYPTKYDKKHERIKT